MEIVAKPDQWTPTDAERLAAFLETETGKRFLPSLAERTPLLLPGGNTNDILIRSGEVRGMQESLQTILFLAHGDFTQTAPGSQNTNYPPLEDDAQWNDGLTLQEPPKPETPK